ncbi:DUF7848 domain-containing protein [Streptomyces flavofungini]|uniref:DUF7848 domain-containing protein n=1 Tax=Streptomyces flavofungini TaxID=68200 RepID=UPI003F5425DA
MPLRCVGRCLTCGELSDDAASANAAQMWCLKHAERTHHGSYELSAFKSFSATMADSTASGSRPPASVRRIRRRARSGRRAGLGRAVVGGR